MSVATMPQNQDPSTAAQGAPPPAGRDAVGRFAKGNKAGHGNPFARQVAQLKSRVLRFLTEEKLDNVLEGIYTKACAGDVGAAKLLLQYALGQPGRSVEPDRVEVEEWKLMKESAVDWGEWVPMMDKCLPAGVVCLEARDTWPLIQGDLATELCAKAARQEARKAERRAPAPSADGSNGGKQDVPAASRPSTNGPDGGLDSFDRWAMQDDELPSIVNHFPAGGGAGGRRPGDPRS